ncbi:hypothetical protein MPTK1_7g18400 [Marchantia polymorpha subsp. ruderalis]|uniref:C-terminal of Roc (COR) domain-containing protein n=1 Tax=Marchantia polymorpha subsp. ruderalis TaxID=1480154 RepID=A0AAF6C136_MARPO|nr:hypothetical protein Mp_7g18400 [Marchantia polymorpha subsp. ruderalis]
MPGLHFACVFQAANVSSSVRMEGAGASIVSHAAETRGMDSADEEPETSHVREADDDVMVPSEIREIYSADEEPETSHVSETDEQKLPSAVMDLIRRLEGAGEPFLGLPNLRWSEFFPVRELLSTIKGWRSEVRLRVLEAIGRCDTFIQLDIQTIFGGDISRLTASEWERVLRGFRSSTHLREIRVEDLTWISDEEVESLCLHLGIILNSSSVTELKIGNCSLSARCFLNLASGLRGNSKSQLQSLELRRAWEDSSAVKHVADMINSAPLLKTLSLSGYLNHRNDMDEETVRILSQALIQRSSLKELVLVEVEWGAALLLQALAGEDRNRSIERLHLHDMVRLGDCLRQVLSSNASLKEMSLHSLRMRPEEWHQLGEFISDNARAVHIYVHFGFDQNVEDNWKSIEALACPARFRARDLTVELDLKPPSDHDFLLSLKLLGRILRGEIKALESFNISFSTWPPFTDNRLETILSMDGKTGETSVLKKLGLHVKNTYKEDEDLFLCLKGAWKHLFWCLQGNKSLTHLDLCGSKLDDEGFRDLMGLLQVNFTLEKIDVTGTSWEKDGKAAQINEALKRKQAEYMSVFTEAGLTFGDARAGRLVLCGSPRAGKTRLRHTLMRIVEAKSWLGNKWDELRTNGMKGIEVEFLQKNDRREISIWDVAGQQYFCTIRRLLFPQSSNFCVFLFVYSPFFPEQSRYKPDSCLMSELEEWLIFITSCTTIHNRPQVLVVISHKDKKSGLYYTSACSIVNKLAKRFAKFVHVHPIQPWCHVDARNKKQVIPLKNKIFLIFETMWNEKFLEVPQLCFLLSSLLVTRPRDIKSRPVWSYYKFFLFCASSLAEFSSFTDLPSYRYITRGIIIEEMISYLNDIGSIIFIPNTDCIIVNPNWLITTLAHPLTQHTMSHASHTSKDGFVSESVFAGLIEVFLRSQPHGQRGVNREMLENILINLDLCFKLEDSSQYFIPLLLPEHGGAHVESMAWKTKDETSKFVGIRIQCQDQRTMSLTADFFARFQMFMIRKLIYEMHVSEKNVGYSQNCLQLLLDGHEIYVEQGTRIEQGTRNTYVDVLMLCPTYRSRSEDLRYVMKHIVQELISFCASPKGCPGVALVLGVIQTFCVEMLIPSHLRGAILIENLRSKFICSIKDKLEDIPLDCLHLENEDGLFDYEHSWPFIEGHTTESIFERARDLLWESDVEAVLNEIRQHRIQQLESLQQGLINVNNDLVHSHLEYFFPSFIREYASMEEHPYVVLGGARGGPHMESMAWKTKDETSKFVGIRIQREDGRTMSLTSAFFPCFQMFIKRKLISEMHVSKKKTVTCSQYYLRILLDGHEIYVEQGTSHNYVDVLMLCSKHKSRLGALQYMMKHIVQEVLSFYASPKGCPGVALVLGVIQTHCVKELKPSVLRKAILIEELKSNFTRRINDNLRIFRWKNRT